MEKRILPKEIEAIVGDKEYTVDGVGMSRSEVRIYDDYVLKIQEKTEETDNEYEIVKWLAGRVPTPQIPVYHVEDGLAYTLMTKVHGKMLCDPEYIKDPQKVIEIVADSMKALWAVDAKDCPLVTSRLSERLKAAEYNVVNGLVDTDNVEPETFGPGGFKDPAELLEWLKSNRPEEDLVLTHGDYCLPNLFADGGKFSSFIDLGKMGPADRWQDIAIAIRSLDHNFDGRHSDGKRIIDFKPEMLLDRLGIKMDEEKYKYYILLDELF